MIKEILIIIVLSIGLFVGCTPTFTVDEKQTQQQEQNQKDMDNQIGLPNITNWTEKKLAKRILELRDDSKLICYAYTKNTMTGKYVFEGQCIGFGLPYSTQYTNPMKYEYAGTTLPQNDPNGLFAPASADATWVIMINEETGKSEIQYYEDKIDITQTKKPRRICEEYSLPKNY